MVSSFIYLQKIPKDKTLTDLCMESLLGLGVLDLFAFSSTLETRNLDFLAGMMLIVGGGVRERLMTDTSVMEEEVLLLDSSSSESSWMKIFWSLLRWMNKTRSNSNLCIEPRRIIESEKKNTQYCFFIRTRFNLWTHSLIKLGEQNLNKRPKGHIAHLKYNNNSPN